MTSNAVTPEEIERLAQSKGPVTAAANLGIGDYRDEALITALAEGASRRNVLISADDEDLLDSLAGSRFFEVQTILDEVIPKLRSQPAQIMGLVRRLVEKGGDDLAANQPNAAFRKWCAVDQARADAVIKAARSGDEDALHHLVFALEANGDPETAMQSAKATDAERTAGILALSRLPLDQEQAQRALALILEFVEEATPQDAAGLLHAGLAVADKHEDLDRSSLASALAQLSASNDPTALHLLATALHWHQPKMTREEYQACLLGVRSVNPDNAGTMKEIDRALTKLRAALYGVLGTDLTQIHGLGPSLALKLVSECGTDLRAWKSAKHFTSRLCLAPGNKISGGKLLSSKTRRSSSRAAALLRLAAVTLGRSDTALGAFYRRLSARIGKQKAVTATARKIAVLFYNAIRHGMTYQDQGAAAYDERHRKRVLSNLQRRAKTMGFALAPISDAEAVS